MRGSLARARTLSIAALVVLGACKDDSPKISLTPSTTSLNLAQTASSTVTITVARSHFDGPVSLTVVGAPDGVIALVSPTVLQKGTSTATLDVDVTGAAPPGSYTLTLKATGEGVAEQSVDIALTVTTTGSFGFSVLEPTVQIAQGGGGAATILIPRFQNNGGNVTVTPSGVPTGVTATIVSSPTTTSSATMSFSATSGAAVGTYPISLVASQAGFANQSASFSLVITAPAPTAPLNVPFCLTSMPAWFAYKNQGFDWQRVTPTGNVFTFQATDRVSVAFVFTSSAENQTTVFSATRAELAASNDRDCDGTKSLSGSVAGLGSGQSAHIVMGTSATTVAANGAFSLTNVNERALDLVAIRGATTGSNFTPDRLVVRRSQSLANGATIPLIDFGAEGFAPASNALTVTGTASSDAIDMQNSFWSATSTLATMQFLSATTGTNTLYAVPAAQQIAGDLHELYVDAYTQTTSSVLGHSYVEYYTAPADKTAALGPVAGTATLNTIATAPYARVRARVDAQTEYNTSVRFGFFQQPNTGAQRIVTIGVSAGYLGGTPTTWDVSIPELSLVPGFNANWMLVGDEPTQYYVEPFSGRTDLLFGALPAVGDVVRFSYRVGLIFTAQLRGDALHSTDMRERRMLPQYLRR